jgi:excisionase family DNA binding protein
VEEDGVVWMTKAEAVTYSGISLRTIEREISLKKVRTKQRRQVGRRSVTVVHPTDVERLRKDFTPMSAQAVDLPASLPVNTEVSDLPSPRSQLDMVTAVLQYLRPFVEGKPAFLPVKEAAQYIGLPEGYLRKCIKEGRIKPIVHGGHYLRLADLYHL